MTGPRDATPPSTSGLRARAAALPAGAWDALSVVFGAILIILAVGAVDWRAGLFTAGVMLLAAVVVGRLLQRARP